MTTQTATATTTSEAFRAFWLKSPVLSPVRYGEQTWKPVKAVCPICGRETEDGNCYNPGCVIGFEAVKREVGTYLPEDWLMVEAEEEEEEGPAPFSPCPECGDETDESGACWNRYCPEGSANIGDKQYHEMVDMELCA